MKIIEEEDVHRVLTYPDLIEALRETFATSAGTPRRNVYPLEENDPFHDAFGVLPAWNKQAIGVKAFTYLPSNVPNGEKILHSKILLFARENGAPLALVDGTSVTYWRTAAVAGLAADYLARKDAKRLLICGTGNLSSYMTLAHAAVRDYIDIAVWGRNVERAKAAVEAIKQMRGDLSVRVAGDLEAEAREADVISCATAAKEPLILGEWVKPGSHTDFSGNHQRTNRECDSELVVKSGVYVDSRDNVMNEGGEILIPLEEGRIRADHVVGELSDLCAGRVMGRQSADEITLFKSVGTALSDLGAELLVMQRQ